MQFQSKWIILAYDHRSIPENIYWKLKVWVVWFRTFQGLTLTFKGQRSPWVRNDFCHMKAHTRFSIQLLLTLSRYLVSFTIYFNFKVFRVWPWRLTVGGHLGSKIFLSIESIYLISYLTSIDFFSLSRIVFFSNLTLKFFQGFNLTFDLWRKLKVWHFSAIRNPIHNFLYT